jgi:hypothetical protein
MAETAEDVRAIVDLYMPTIITGINHMSERSHKKDREDWTEDDIATMAAYSYAHNMLKRLGAPQNVRSDQIDSGIDYDLPSVLDLIEMAKRRTKAIDQTLAEFPEARKYLARFEGTIW